MGFNQLRPSIETPNMKKTENIEYHKGPLCAHSQRYIEPPIRSALTPNHADFALGQIVLKLIMTNQGS